MFRSDYYNAEGCSQALLLLLILFIHLFIYLFIYLFIIIIPLKKFFFLLLSFYFSKEEMEKLD